MKKALYSLILLLSVSNINAQHYDTNGLEFTVSDTVQVEPDKYFFNLTVSEKGNYSLYEYDYGDDLYNDDPYYNKPQKNKKETEAYNVSLAKAEKLIKDMKIKQIPNTNNNFTIISNNNNNTKTFYLEFPSAKALADFVEKAKDLQNVYGVLSGTELSEQKRRKAEDRLMQKLTAENNRNLQNISKSFGLTIGKIISMRFYDDVSPTSYYGYEGDYYISDLMHYTNYNKTSSNLITIKKTLTVKYELK